MPRNATELSLFGVALIWILRVLKALLRLSIKALREGWGGGGVGKREAKGKMSLPQPLSKVYFIKVSCAVNNRNTSDPFLECNPEIK